jgi:hypothetical protein
MRRSTVVEPRTLAVAFAALAPGCTMLNPGFLDDAGVSASDTSGADGAETKTTDASASNSGDGDTGDGDGTSGDGDGDTGDGDGTSGDGDGAIGDGDGDGDGTFDFECPELDDSLVGCWPFDGDGADWSFYGHDLTVSDATYGSGVSDMAIEFSDLSLANVNTSVALSPTNYMTIEFWMKPGPRTVYTLISKSSSYEVGVENGELVCSFGNAGTVVVPVTLDPSSWQHVACVHAGTSIQLYVDAVQMGAVAASSTIPASSAALHVGSLSPSWSNWYDGKLDNLRLWSRALTHSELCEAAGVPCP